MAAPIVAAVLTLLAVMPAWLAAASGPARAEDLSVWLTEPLVPIDSGFAGARIYVFGGVAKSSPAAPPPDGVIVVVRGPPEEAPVREKKRHGIFWIAGQAWTADNAPSYYFVSGTSGLDALVSDAERTRREIGADRLQIAFRAPPAPKNKIDNRIPADLVAASQPFRQALISARTDEGLYVEADEAVEWRDRALFRAAINLPANTPVGAYQVDVHVARGGRIVASRTTPFYVDKIGIERRIYNLAHDLSFGYGLICVGVSLLAGWAAALIFER